jgi:hypothetical protein
MVALVVAPISASGLASGDQVPVDGEMGAPLAAPGQSLLDPGTSHLCWITIAFGAYDSDLIAV